MQPDWASVILGAFIPLLGAAGTFGWMAFELRWMRKAMNGGMKCQRNTNGINEVRRQVGLPAMAEPGK